MEQKEYDAVIKKLIEKEKNDEILTLREACILSAYKQSKQPKFDFSKVKIIRDEEER